MLLNDLLLFAVELLIALAALNLLFIHLTRTPGDPVQNVVLRVVQPPAYLFFQWVMALFVCFAVGSALLRTPGSVIAARYPELTPDAVDKLLQSGMPDWMAGGTVAILLSFTGIIFVFITAAQRLDRKTWDVKEADTVTRLLRAYSFLLNDWGWALLALTVIGGILLFNTRLPQQAALLPDLLPRALSGDLGDSARTTALLTLLGVAGLGLWVLIELYTALQASAARGWTQVPGVITSSRLRVSFGSRGARYYHAAIAYSYEAHGTTLKSERIHFGGASDTRADAWRLLERFPAGTAVTVCHHPNNPADAVLLTDARGRSVMNALLTFAAAVLIGLSLIPL